MIKLLNQSDCNAVGGCGGDAIGVTECNLHNNSIINNNIQTSAFWGLQGAMDAEISGEQDWCCNQNKGFSWKITAFTGKEGYIKSGMCSNQSTFSTTTRKI